MPKFKYQDSAAKRKRRSEARANGREGNAAYTSGAREVGFPKDPLATNKEAWETKSKVDTYSQSKFGRMNDGRVSKAGNKVAGGVTHSFTQKAADGKTTLKQSSRGMLSRRKRYYEVRVGLGMAGG